MIKLSQLVIVEGKYDKIKLETIIDAPIVVTNGFAIFKDKEKMNYIRAAAKKRGIIIITDSDSAGFLIRSHISGCVPKEFIKNVYLPDIFGKERRKDKPSKEGLLGVEGIDNDIIINALENAGITSEKTESKSRILTKADLFELGLSGGANSKQKREKLLKLLNLPQRMTTNALLDAVNIFYTYDEFTALLQKLSED